MELTQLYFKLFPSVCLAKLQVLLCLKQAVLLVQERPAVSWQPSQNIPAGGRQKGRTRWEGKKIIFLISSTKDCACKYQIKDSSRINGRKGVTHFLEGYGRAWINYHENNAQEYLQCFFRWYDSWPEILLCFLSRPCWLLFFPITLISWFWKSLITQRKNDICTKGH